MPYPEGPVTPALMTVAQTIKQDLGLRVATVDVGGWDTHVAQAGQFGGSGRGTVGQPDGVLARSWPAGSRMFRSS